MSYKKLFLFVFFFSSFVMDKGEAGLFNPETFTLKNGLQVIVIPNPRAPVVEHSIWYKVGSVNDPSGKSGLAHFMEHMMFKGGTPLDPKGKFKQVIFENGGEQNAITSYNFTAYYQVIASNRLELMMQYEADRMQHATFPEEEVESEKKVVLEERRMYENEPSFLLMEGIGRALYWQSPYGIPPIGWKNEIKKIQREDLLAFHQNWYAPNNAILIVAGDITAEKLKPLAEKYYGPIPPKPLPNDLPLKEPNHHNVHQKVTLTHQRVTHPSLSFYYKVPAFKNRKDLYTLQVLTSLLAGARDSRWIETLKEKQELILFCSLDYTPHLKEEAYLSLSFTAAPNVSLEKLKQVILQEIEKLLKKGITAAELKKAKQNILASRAYALDDISAGVNAFGTSLIQGFSIEEIEEFITFVEATSLPEVEDLIKTLLNQDPQVIAYLLPEREKND